MKKSLTIALVLAAFVVFTDLALAQQPQEKQSPPTTGGPPPRQPVPQEATTINASKSNASERYTVDNPSPTLLKGIVTEVNGRARTFTVAVVVSASKLNQLPTVREMIDITYTANPGGGPMEAVTVNSSKSNGSERTASGTASSNQPIYTGAPAEKTTTVKGSKSNSHDRISSGTASSNQPIYTGAPVEEATTVSSIKSNSSDRIASGTALLNVQVMEVNNRARIFTVAIVFSGAALRQLPTVGQTVDVSFTEAPNGVPKPASNLNLSKSNIN